jgi:hypothetical protein
MAIVTANDIHYAPNPSMSQEQKAFEEWARSKRYNLNRNHMCPYHGAPYTYEELFGAIDADHYYMDKTQDAWNGWRARGSWWRSRFRFVIGNPTYVTVTFSYPVDTEIEVNEKPKE